MNPRYTECEADALTTNHYTIVDLNPQLLKDKASIRSPINNTIGKALIFRRINLRVGLDLFYFLINLQRYKQFYYRFFWFAFDFSLNKCCFIKVSLKETE